MATCKNCIHEKVCKYTNEKISIGTTVSETIHECKDYVSATDVVEVVRCKDCKYFIPEHIKLDDGTTRAYTEEEKKASFGCYGRCGYKLRLTVYALFVLGRKQYSFLVSRKRFLQFRRKERIMTDNEIIKALECCGSDDPCGEECFGHDMNGTAQCTTILAQNALDLINRQKADIETLENNLKFVRGTVTRVIDENESLKKRLDSHCNNCRMRDRKERDRAEAIKEFAERLKGLLSLNIRVTNEDYLDIAVEINNLVKEMVGEGK